jgi:hypothetical protein
MTDTLLTLLLVILWICSVWAVGKAFKWIGKW